MTVIKDLYRLFYQQTQALCFVLDAELNLLDCNDAAKLKFKIPKTERADQASMLKEQGESTVNMLDLEILVNKARFKVAFETFKTQPECILKLDIKNLNQAVESYELYLKQIPFEGTLVYLCNAHLVPNDREVESRILSAVIETEEKERSRFAKELHDGLGPLLSTIKLYAHELDPEANTISENLEYKQEIIGLLDEAISNTREISNNLTPQILSNYGLVKSLETFISKINASGKIAIDFMNDSIPVNLPKAIELTIFRVLAELINNTLKHAFAQQIHINLYAQDQALYLEYQDDGIGFQLEKALKKGSSGIGLANIINRIKSLSGDIKFKSESEKGVQIQCMVKF
jgi:signal transduction histidine kinase